MPSTLDVEYNNQLASLIEVNNSRLCVLPKKGLYIPKHLCKNTGELMQEQNIEKLSILEAYLGPCQFSLMDPFAKIVRLLAVYYICKNISIAPKMFDRVLNTSLYTLSNSFILCITPIIFPFHMGIKSR